LRLSNLNLGGFRHGEQVFVEITKGLDTVQSERVHLLL
jgi:hypothetical protein